MMNTNFSDYLTPKQQAFCDEYLLDRNATRAALKAGYSASTAMNGRLMTMPKIKLYLQQRMDELSRKVQVSQEQVLAELCKIAFGNMGNYFGGDGCLKPMHDLTDDAKAALWSVSVSDAGSGGTVGNTVTKIRMYNKLSALDKIAKHINFYKSEPVSPAKEYVYLDKDDMTEDDSFDDYKLQEELHAEKVRKKRLEERRLRAEKKSMVSQLEHELVKGNPRKEKLTLACDGNCGSEMQDEPVADEPEPVKTKGAYVDPYPEESVNRKLVYGEDLDRLMKGEIGLSTFLSRGNTNLWRAEAKCGRKLKVEEPKTAMMRHIDQVLWGHDIDPATYINLPFIMKLQFYCKVMGLEYKMY